MQNNSPQISSPTSTVQSAQSGSPRQGWAIPIICTLITAAGAAYTAYSNYKTQSVIETLKANTEQQVTKIKADSEREIKQAELRSQEDIIRLKDQIDAQKELRAQIAAKESAVISARATRCDEIKAIRNGMSSDITHLQYNDSGTSDALLNLQAADNKLSSYLTKAGLSALRSALPEKDSLDRIQGYRNYYRAVLEGYNAELRVSCAQ